MLCVLAYSTSHEEIVEIRKSKVAEEGIGAHIWLNQSYTVAINYEYLIQSVATCVTAPGHNQSAGQVWL